MAMSIGPLSERPAESERAGARGQSATTFSFKADGAAAPARPVLQSMWRGFLGRCPNCGRGSLFRAYLKVNDACPACGEELHHHRADDAPPYVTILIVGHVVVGALLAVELSSVGIPLWVEGVGWSALALVLSLLVLPRVKGALVALQWALRMHGFEYAPTARPGGGEQTPTATSKPAKAPAATS
jgi:uncharacterized protein (DUF983 family)